MFIKFHFFGIMLFVMLWATKWYHICYIKVKVENFIEFKVPHFYVAEKLCDENCSTQHIPYGTLSGAYMQNFSPVGLKLMLACFTKVFVHTHTHTNGQTYKNRGETIQGAFGALKKPSLCIKRAVKILKEVPTLFTKARYWDKGIVHCLCFLLGLKRPNQNPTALFRCV